MAAYVFKRLCHPYYLTIEAGLATEASAPSGGICAIGFYDELPVDKWGVYLFAGKAAQWRGILLRNGWDKDDPHADASWERVNRGADNDHIEFIKQGGKEEDFQAAWDAAKALVYEHWHLVEALSSALLAQRTLYHEEPYTVLEGIVHGGAERQAYLHVYRRWRQEIEPVGDWVARYRAAHPHLPWYESMATCLQRENIQPGEDFLGWYCRKVGLVDDRGEGDSDDHS